MKTIFFEEKYKTDISRFSSIRDIDSFLETETGKKMKIKKIKSNLVSRSGNIFSIISYDIKNEFRKMLGIK